MVATSVIVSGDRAPIQPGPQPLTVPAGRGRLQGSIRLQSDLASVS